jgi:hypothetical protein
MYMSEKPKQNPSNSQYTLKKIKDEKVKQVLSRGDY